jgi:1-acyl-sn-glycerol-3-phosphate acyltransferase
VKREDRPVLGRDPFAPRPPPESGEPEATLAEGTAEFEKRVRRELARARRLASPGFYADKLGELRMHGHSEEVDEFGLDPAYVERWQRLFDFLFEKYWRVEAEGIERIPAAGGTILVANHAGLLPYDAAMLRCALLKHHPERRSVRPLVPDFVFHFPFLGTFINRIGGVRACQENAERLLGRGELVAVFPEGVKGLTKLYRERYRLQRFGRGGFVKLALRTGAPLYPVAIVGSEEVHPVLGRVEWVASKLGIPYVPVTPTFPLLGPLGLVPLPSKWKMRVGDPIDLGGMGAAAADDPIGVGRIAERVRATLQEMVRDLLRQRKSVFFG